MDRLKDLLYRLQDHPLYRKWEDIPRPKKMLGFALTGLSIAILILIIQLTGSGTPLVELKPDEIAAAKAAAREADHQVLQNLDPKALKDELERRKISMDEAHKSADPDRIREAEESWERVNEAMQAKKK